MSTFRDYITEKKKQIFKLDDIEFDSIKQAKEYADNHMKDKEVLIHIGNLTHNSDIEWNAGQKYKPQKPTGITRRKPNLKSSM